MSHVFKVKSGLSPEYMSEQFIPASSLHSYGIRFRVSGFFTIPKVKGFGKRSFGYNGCVLGNDLPNSFKSLQPHNSLKWQLKLTF